MYKTHKHTDGMLLIPWHTGIVSNSPVSSHLIKGAFGVNPSLQVSEHASYNAAKLVLWQLMTPLSGLDMPHTTPNGKTKY